MYLHIGQNFVIKTSEIVGIFDMDTATIQKNTRNFLNENEKMNNLCVVSQELPKSFIVCKSHGAVRVFVTPLNSSTVMKRLSGDCVKKGFC